jgi:hypothetical protein
MSSLLSDPWFAAKVEEVVARYRHLWTEEQVRAFREAAAWKLATHPEARRRLEEERAKEGGQSGTRPKDGVASGDVARAVPRKGVAG